MCDWIWEQLGAMSHLLWPPSWEKTIKSCVFVCATARIYHSCTCDHQTHWGENTSQLDWALLLSVPPFSHSLSFPPSLRNLQVTLRSQLVSTIPHISSLSSLPSNSAHILHPSTSHPEAPISTKDVRQWIHTDQMRQCVSSITGHREQ